MRLHWTCSTCGWKFVPKTVCIERGTCARFEISNFWKLLLFSQLDIDEWEIYFLYLCAEKEIQIHDPYKFWKEQNHKRSFAVHNGDIFRLSNGSNRVPKQAKSQVWAGRHNNWSCEVF